MTRLLDYFGNLLGISKGRKFETAEKECSEGISKSRWSLHIGSFWKTHFINPPESLGFG
jgi:hypothetical protein